MLEGHEPEPSFLHAAMVDLDEDESGTVNFEELFAWHFRGALQGRLALSSKQKFGKCCSNVDKFWQILARFRLCLQRILQVNTSIHFAAFSLDLQKHLAEFSKYQGQMFAKAKACQKFDKKPFFAGQVGGTQALKECSTCSRERSAHTAISSESATSEKSEELREPQLLATGPQPRRARKFETLFRSGERCGGTHFHGHIG